MKDVKVKDATIKDIQAKFAELEVRDVIIFQMSGMNPGFHKVFNQDWTVLASKLNTIRHSFDEFQEDVDLPKLKKQVIDLRSVIRVLQENGESIGSQLQLWSKDFGAVDELKKDVFTRLSELLKENGDPHSLLQMASKAMESTRVRYFCMRSSNALMILTGGT